jgi:hypothetical protein
MGGGNGLKSTMAREKKQAKDAAAGKGGGGKDGIKSRTESAIGTQCALCKTPFQSVKMKAQLKDHWEGMIAMLAFYTLHILHLSDLNYYVSMFPTAKHSRNDFAECFPGIDPP